ncbi:MAG: DUF5009 domain-containing protein [Phycisphaerae bacterium]
MASIRRFPVDVGRSRVSVLSVFDGCVDSIGPDPKDREGAGTPSITQHVIKRGLLLGFFAVYIQHIKPYTLSQSPKTQTWFIALLGLLRSLPNLHEVAQNIFEQPANCCTFNRLDRGCHSSAVAQVSRFRAFEFLD